MIELTSDQAARVAQIEEGAASTASGLRESLVPVQEFLAWLYQSNFTISKVEWSGDGAAYNRSSDVVTLFGEYLAHLHETLGGYSYNPDIALLPHEAVAAALVTAAQRFGPLAQSAIVVKQKRAERIPDEPPF